MNQPLQILDNQVKVDTFLETSIDSSQTKELKYLITLVTPMMGGGVEAGEPDKNHPFREKALRGKLRFWWRLLAKAGAFTGVKKGINGNELYQAEAELFGGDSKNENTNKNLAKLNRLKIKFYNIKDIDNISYKEPKVSNRNNKKKLDWINKFKYPDYALFPADVQGKSQINVNNYDTLVSGIQKWKIARGNYIPPKELIKEGASSNLILNINIGEQNKRDFVNEIKETMRWWVSFDGFGSRTRRGLGKVKVKVKENSDIEFKNIDSISIDDARKASCHLILSSRTSKEPLEMWDYAIAKLRDFRQGRIGRNFEGKIPKRSFWPEADIIRNKTKQSLNRHKPNHPVLKISDNLFPRASFGLPITFKFIHNKYNEINPNLDPATKNLLPQHSNRLASPVFLIPYWNGNSWQPAALLLPNKHIWVMSVKTEGAGANFTNNSDWWPRDQKIRKDVASELKPMQHPYVNYSIGTKPRPNVTYPISSFLNYFKNDI